MTEITPEEKIKLFEKLPKELRDFMESEDTGAFLLYLGEKYNLPDEKVSALSKIVGDIILKITPITSLAQEIANKVIPDSQIAMTIAQELNSELLMPVLTPTPAVPMTPALPTRREEAVGTPTPAERGVGAAPMPRADQYREPTIGAPEVVDLRKTPPPPIQIPVAAAPIPFTPTPPQAGVGAMPPRPLTFTKPVEPPVAIKVEPPKPMPLIEAEPHRVAAPPPSDLPRPQYIIRPPGIAPTDLPHDVLDLRKDKGEF